MQEIRGTRDHTGQGRNRIRSVNENTSILTAVQNRCQGSLRGPSENVNLSEQNHFDEMNHLHLSAIIALVIELHLWAKLAAALTLVEVNETAQPPRDQCVHLLNQSYQDLL